MASRREFLKDLSLGSGAVLLSPLVQRVQAAERGELPKRFVFVVKSSGLETRGLVPQSFAAKPRDVGGVTMTSLKDAKLNKYMASLEPFRDRMSMLDGLSAFMVSVGHSAQFGALGVYNSPGHQPPLRATIDGLLAQHFPAVFNHLGLMMEPGKTVAFPLLSASGPNRPLHFRCSPEVVYTDLFASVASNEDVVKKFKMSGNILDFVNEDLRKLRGTLGQSGRDQLDHYAEAFDTLKDRRHKLASMNETLKNYAPEYTDKYTSDIGPHHLEAHFEMASAALISGITNVATINCDTLATTYETLGFRGHVHGIGHGAGDGDLSFADCRDLIRKFQIDLIARLAHDLDNVPEGEGTMLDNTIIVYMSDNAQNHHANNTNWPFLILGGMGGKLKLGDYVKYPAYGAKGHRTLGNFHTTITHAAGLPMEHFGNLDFRLQDIDQKGPLHELLA